MSLVSHRRHAGTMTKAIVDALRQNLRQALAQRRLAEAEQILSRLKKENPLSVETRGFELELFIESDRIEEATSLAEQLCRTFPDSARIFFLAGKLAYRRKNYEAAEARFRESQRIYPSAQTQYWLGKTLTQTGHFEEAESLLISVRDQNPWALLVLGWLHERRNDFESALKAYDDFLEHYPGNRFASEQRVRIKAKLLDPEALIDEANMLADFGERLPDAMFVELVEKLFETGQTPRAREEIGARLDAMEPREGVRVAWICYRHQAYDLACALFLNHLRANLFNFKYLSALEAAARKCDRLPQVLDAYRGFGPEARHLYGRRKFLKK